MYHYDSINFQGIKAAEYQEQEPPTADT